MTVQRYSIGEMSEISNISKKTLRYYDQLGLISSKRCGNNNYRYYTHEDLLSVPPLKYYKQMGFKLEEMRSAIDVENNSSLSLLRKMFREKMQELQEEQELLNLRVRSVRDWLDLLTEAEMVIQNDLRQVAVKYIPPEKVLFLEQLFQQELKSTIINVAFTNYVESLGNNITGPVMVRFSSREQRVSNENQPVQILQRVIRPCPEEKLTMLGGCLMASCYHIGSHDSINDTYRKIRLWCASNNYVLDESSVERYVTDYWTTKNENLFVTEVLVRVCRPHQCEDTLSQQR